MGTASQTAQIKAHLEAGGTITAIEALEDFGSFRLSARILEIKESGLPITDIWETHGDKRFKRYAKAHE